MYPMIAKADEAMAKGDRMRARSEAMATTIVVMVARA
jgi:hypothetical protein